MEEQKNNETVAERLQKIRLKLQGMGLKKSGHNNFAGFDYFELQDILPAINEECLTSRLITIFNASKDLAMLTIADAIDPSKAVVFSIPFAMPEIRGANSVQNLGGAVTYLRRYLMLIAFEICEPDVSDATIGKSRLDMPTQKQEVAPKPTQSATVQDKKYMSASIIEKCGFGRNKGEKWVDMPNDRLEWYANNYYQPRVGKGGDFEEENNAILEHIKSILAGRNI